MEQDPSSTLVVSPGGSVYYLPSCVEELKPYIGQCFSSLEVASCFYSRYANHCGFDVRKGTLIKCTDESKLPLRRYLLCNRQGVKSARASNHDQNRRRITNRCNCNANITFKYVARKGYVVHKF